MIDSPNEKVNFTGFGNNIEVYIKREDLLDKFVSGNKFRKLKYNLLKAKEDNHTTVLTFGGAFSNHISAVSYACKLFGFKSIGIIRGEELHDKIEENQTLKFAQQNGMNLDFVSRSDYREKDTAEFIDKLKQKYGSFYLVPEGGTNNLAVKGCEEILQNQDDI